MILEHLNYSRRDAIATGCAEKATIINFIRWSIHHKTSNASNYIKDRYFFDGHWWMQDSIQAWENRMPWLSRSTIARNLAQLCEMGILIKRIAVNSYGSHEPSFYRLADEYAGELYEKTENNSVEGGSSKMTPPPSDFGGGSVRMRQGVVSECDRGSVKMNITSLSNRSSINLCTIEQTRAHEGATGEACFASVLNLSGSPKELVTPPEAQKGTASASSTPKVSEGTPKKSKAVKTQIWTPDDPFAAVFENMCKVSICKARFDTEEYRGWLTKNMAKHGLTIAELVDQTDLWQEYHNDTPGKVKSAKGSLNTWIGNYLDRRNRARQFGQGKQQPKRVDLSADNGKWEGFDDNKPF